MLRKIKSWTFAIGLGVLSLSIVQWASAQSASEAVLLGDVQGEGPTDFCESGVASCFPLVKDHELHCGHVVSWNDMDGSCGSADNPCIAGWSGIEKTSLEGCAEVFTLNYAQDGAPSESCADNWCPSYTRSIVVRAEYPASLPQGLHSTFSLNQGAFRRLCPFLCDNHCVSGQTDCLLRTNASCAVSNQLAVQYRDGTTACNDGHNPRGSLARTIALASCLAALWPRN